MNMYQYDVNWAADGADDHPRLRNQFVLGISTMGFLIARYPEDLTQHPKRGVQTQTPI